MNTKKIAGTGIFTALTIVFTLISNYLPIGSISINLSLVPVAIAGILYGPLSGLFVGLVNGAFVMLAPSTMAVFFPMNAWGTVITCLIKTSLAGLLSALIYRLIRRKNDLAGMITASLLVPVINTGIFIGCCFLFFRGIVGNIISIYLLFNFLIEFFTSIVLSPIICKTIIHVKANNKNKLDV